MTLNKICLLLIFSFINIKWYIRIGFVVFCYLNFSKKLIFYNYMDAI
jgi:hypothetical protein